MANLLMEIPTGAFADMMGKKKTLIIAFLLQGLGNVLMGFSSSFWMLALSLWLLVCVGGAFYSGTIDALIYDSLKVLKEESLFGRKIGALGAMRLWSMAICSVIGGFAYYISPGLPFILNGTVCLVGLVACFFLTEPKIDTEKYTLMSFFRQNTMGFRTLFKGEYMKKLSLYLAVTGAFSLVLYMLLDDLLAVEYGFSPMGVSLLFAAVCLVAGFAAVYLPRWKIKFNQRVILITSMIVIGSLLMLSPLIGMIASGIFLLIRVIFEVLYDNAASVEINHHIESEVRATTLSSLNLLRSIPYALCGTLIGSLVQVSGGARHFSVWFGLTLVIVTVVLGLRLERKSAD